MIGNLCDSLLSVVFPVECSTCGREVEAAVNGPACGDCWSKTRIFTGNEMLCTKCGAFFSSEAAPVGVSCHRCDDHHYDKAVAVGIYEKSLAAAIIRLKTTPVLPRRVIDGIRAALNRIDLNRVDLIMPVPLSKQRYLERGFNQAEFISRELSRQTGIGLDPVTLARTVHTQMHRIGMDKRGRELAVQKAFVVQRPNLVAGKNVLLVDDVFTSGATSSACAKALRKAGAGKVYVFTLARAVMN